MNNQSILEITNEVFQIEGNAVLGLIDRNKETLPDIVRCIAAMSGRLVITGVGKSGIIGKKIAGTMSSTGTPSIFLHPTDAYHGDLGVIHPNDVIIAISNSGETNELLQLLPFFKSNGNVVISITAKSNSTLSKNATYPLDISFDKEACPLELAPTTSTTLTIAMGDALAIALMRFKDFKREDFARFHPGGSLGKKLLTSVNDVMQKENLPTVTLVMSMVDVVNVITSGKKGCSIVVGDQDEVLGVITDGDLRRAMSKHEAAFFSLKVGELMSSNPVTIQSDIMWTEAEELMLQKKINTLIVSDTNNRLVGLVQIYDVV